MVDAAMLRFLRYVDVQPSGCWRWTGYCVPEGYGRFYWRPIRRQTTAHRWIFERVVRPLRRGEEADHLCRNRRCVNPGHLRAADHRTNTLAGDAPTAINARKTHCKYGHEFTPANTRFRSTAFGGSRECRACDRRKNALAAKRRRERTGTSGVRAPEAAQLTSRRVRSSAVPRN